MEVSLPDLLGSGRRRVLNFANGKTDLAEVYRQTMTKLANPAPAQTKKRLPRGSLPFHLARSAIVRTDPILSVIRS